MCWVIGVVKASLSVPAFVPLFDAWAPGVYWQRKRNNNNFFKKLFRLLNNHLIQYLFRINWTSRSSSSLNNLRIELHSASLRWMNWATAALISWLSSPSRSTRNSLAEDSSGPNVTRNRRGYSSSRTLRLSSSKSTIDQYHSSWLQCGKCIIFINSENISITIHSLKC